MEYFVALNGNVKKYLKQSWVAIISPNPKHRIIDFVDPVKVKVENGKTYLYYDLDDGKFYLSYVKNGKRTVFFVSNNKIL